jgi:MAF protein
MLVLASNSPRRKQLMALGGWNFSVLAAEVDESVCPGESPDVYVLRLAEDKARATLPMLKEPSSSSALVIAADTAVVDLDGTERGGGVILGKPASPAQAEEMLRRLRGRVHQVYTGLVVLRLRDGALFSEVVITDVPMRNYHDEEIRAYIATGDPLDKAGAYAIQHAAFNPVRNLHGCYANVMGLPVCHLARMLAKHGVDPQSDLPRQCQQALNYPCPVYRQALLGADSPLE